MMEKLQVFVATRETQGQRSNDFCWANEGELVTFGFQCDGGYPDDSCGCSRSMNGVTSHKATTTMKVALFENENEKGVDELQALLDILYTSLHDAGWTSRSRDDAMEDAKLLTETARAFEVGDIVEFRGDTFSTRVKKLR